LSSVVSGEIKIYIKLSFTIQVVQYLRTNIHVLHYTVITDSRRKTNHYSTINTRWWISKQACSTSRQRAMHVT